MIHPLQCILLCTLASEDQSGILLAASRSKIFVFSVANGNLIYVWQDATNQIEDLPTVTQPIANTSYNDSHDPSEPPAKRQRPSSPGKEPDSSSAEIVTGEVQRESQKSNKPSTTNSNVIKLAVTSDGRFVVAVTDEDKSIRVLRLEDDRKLQQLSKRQGICRKNFKIQAEKEEASYAPSASLRTVHTLKNRKALRHQLNSTSKKMSPKSIEFEHQLLLGHVSLLTDIVCVSMTRQDVSSANERTYIITSDRDEHIRISRGMPQAHIIERFCLGHTQFVSKLCVPCWDSQMLISGGGDDHLMVWNLLSGRTICTFNLHKWVSDHIDERYACSDLLGSNPIDRDVVQAQHAKIAVSDIHSTETVTAVGEVQRHIVVATEGVPAVFILRVTQNGVIERNLAVSTEGNVVGLTVSNEQHRVAYAMDTDHQSFSQSQVIERENGIPRPSIGYLSFSTARGLWGKDMELQNAIVDGLRDVPESDERTVDGRNSSNRDSVSLYGLENLRKRSSDD
ncbi:MAG: hypothetical protein Q9216_000875 [Gyalolechia sp. 2 TL-2023]